MGKPNRAMATSSTEQRASIFPPAPRMGAKSQAPKFGEAFNQLMALNPERAREFIRNSDLIPPADKLDLSRASQSYLTSQNLRQLSDCGSSSPIKAVAGLISRDAATSSADGKHDLLLSRAEQRTL